MTPTNDNANRRRSSSLTCPECGFKAAHAMGLGRHRTTKHGVRSKRQEREANRVRSADKGLQRRYALMERRLEKVEKQQEQLLKALSRLARIR